MFVSATARSDRRLPVCHGRIIKSHILSNHFSKTDWLSLTVMLVLVLVVALNFILSGKAQADQLNLLLNGKARHVNTEENYNERNWGGGFQYDYGRKTSKWVPFITVSGFIDSLNNPSYYSGGGVLRRFLISRKLDNLHFDAGVVGFLMSRKDVNEGQPFLGALPVMSFGTDMISLNVTYVPDVDERIAELWFMQLKVSSTSFW